MPITIKKAESTHLMKIYKIQIESFKDLLNKYKDYEFSPGAESIDNIATRLSTPTVSYYFICLNDEKIGNIVVGNFGDRCKIKQICILPSFQSRGYAQQAILMVESLYPDAKIWELDTIMQEKKLCYLYEKMGYKKTNKTEVIKDGMTRIFYIKHIMNN